MNALFSAMAAAALSNSVPAVEGEFNWEPQAVELKQTIQQQEQEVRCPIVSVYDLTPISAGKGISIKTEPRLVSTSGMLDCI